MSSFNNFSSFFFILYLKWDRNVWILLSTCLAHESEGEWKNFKYFLLFLSFRGWHEEEHKADIKTKKEMWNGGSNVRNSIEIIEVIHQQGIQIYMSLFNFFFRRLQIGVNFIYDSLIAKARWFYCWKYKLTYLLDGPAFRSNSH